MSVQNSINHCYFVLGMLFEKVRQNTMLRDVVGSLYLMQAYFLISKINQQPSLSTVWHFLLKKPISLKKEEKKNEQLFRLVHLLKYPLKDTYELLQFFVDFSCYGGGKACIILCQPEELHILTSLEELAVFLENIRSYIQFDAGWEDFIKATCTTIVLQHTQIVQYPLLRLTFTPEQDFWSTLDLGMRGSIETLELVSLLEQDVNRKIQLLGRHAISAKKVLQCLYRNPVIQLKQIQKTLGIAKPNAIAFIERAVEAGVLQKITSQKRNNIYSNGGIMHIFFHF